MGLWRALLWLPASGVFEERVWEGGTSVQCQLGPSGASQAFAQLLLARARVCGQELLPGGCRVWSSARALPPLSVAGR